MKIKRAMVSDCLLNAFPDLVTHPGPVPGVSHPYYQDKDIAGPICATAEECMLLHRMAWLCQPIATIEIGSYVGWTAAHIATALRAHGKVYCIDDMSEGNDPELQKRRFDDNMTRAGCSERVRLISLPSPGALALVPDITIDMAFVDGDHNHGQPMIDVQALVPRMTPDGVIIMHDSWMPDVADACRWLVQNGWTQVTYPTAAKIAFFYKQMPIWWTTFVEATSV